MRFHIMWFPSPSYLQTPIQNVAFRNCSGVMRTENICLHVNFCKDHRDKIEVPDRLAVEDLITSKLNKKRKFARLITQYGDIFFPIFRKARPSFFRMLHPTTPWRRKTVPSEILENIWPVFRVKLTSVFKFLLCIVAGVSHFTIVRLAFGESWSYLTRSAKPIV